MLGPVAQLGGDKTKTGGGIGRRAFLKSAFVAP
jgi:hypothetical protein